MLKITPKLIFFIVCHLFITSTYASENAFYIMHSNTPKQALRTQKILDRLEEHAPKINILISQAYRVDANGYVAGFVDGSVKNFARNHDIKLFALITNSGFDKDRAHRFLSNPRAQMRAITTILDECRRHNYSGVQFDFEGISILDKDRLTAFYSMAARALRSQGFRVSFAVVPIVSGLNRSEFQRRRYQNWSGAYDLAKLAKIGDFISVMAYDQHTYGTLPGPIGGYNWVRVAVEQALRYVPANKLSLGIPVYSGYWVMANHPRRRLTIQLNQISYTEVQALQAKYNLKFKWDLQDKVHFAYFNHNWLYDYLFVENARSFKAKYELMHEYKLRGISVFNLGNEDPAIWQVL